MQICHGALQGTYVDETSGYSLTWNVNQQAETIVVTMHSPIQGWVGMGWHCAGCDDDRRMFNADFAIGLLENGVWSAQDRVSQKGQQTGMPELDTKYCFPECGQDNIIASWGFQNASGTWVTWVRQLTTPDTVADHPISLTEPMNVIYAWGVSNTFGYHRSNRGQVSLYFGPNDACLNNSNSHNCTGTKPPAKNLSYLRAWHGSLMLFAFGFMFTMAIFVARYLKGHSWWFPLHWGLVLTATAMITAAFIIIVIEVGNEQFAMAHGRLGLATVIMTYLTVFLGVYCHFSWNPDRKGPPIWPDQVHWWAGRITLVMAYVNIVLGTVMPDFPLSFATSWISGFVFLYFLLVFCAIELYRWYYDKKEKSGYQVVPDETSSLKSA